MPSETSRPLLVIGVISLSVAATWFMITILSVIGSPLGALAATVIAWTILAARGLNDAALAVERLLRSNDEASARDEICALVGRDYTALDHDGLTRATIESVAENSSDGVMAPPLFLFLEREFRERPGS